MILTSKLNNVCHIFQKDNVRDAYWTGQEQQSKLHVAQWGRNEEKVGSEERKLNTSTSGKNAKLCQQELLPSFKLNALVRYKRGCCYFVIFLAIVKGIIHLLKVDNTQV